MISRIDLGRFRLFFDPSTHPVAVEVVISL
jgi:hypothetical protein